MPSKHSQSSFAPEPVWLTANQVRMLHAESLRLFGGGEGMRDPGLLESALDRARNRHAYEPGTSVYRLAAEIAFGIARNHPFVDGKKRAALLSIRAFLFRNGIRFVPDPVEAVVMIEGLAGGTVDVEALTGWIEAGCR